MKAQTQQGKGHVSTGQRLERCSHEPRSAKRRQQAWEARKRQDGTLPQAFQREQGPADTSMSDVRPLKL